MTYSAALEQHVAAPDDIVDCQGGQIKLAGRVIHDDQGEHFGRITVHKALEGSSDVAAVKMALKVGPDRFYQYVRDFGFGAPHGCGVARRDPRLAAAGEKMGSSSIGSIAMGQEVAVTPLQLVSMVSTIANGGIYLPPHVLMPGQLDHPSTSGPQAKPQASPFKPGEELPDPLPTGAHRVLSTLTAAQMRKMMEGVVLYGTGKAAQLNGYSSGGKTGTAQKIDPDTHRYSKTMHIASFAGLAPVNNPVIAVAVIIDTPKGDYHGATVSAPVFAEVAQQILEYLGVAHDIEVRATHASKKATAWRRTRAESTAGISMRSTPRPTICPPTIPCAGCLASRWRNEPRCRGQDRAGRQSGAGCSPVASARHEAGVARSGRGGHDRRGEAAAGAGAGWAAGAQSD